MKRWLLHLTTADGKRCETCGRAGATRGGVSIAPAVPEPSTALLFGLGVLAVRARLGRRAAVR